MTAGKFQFDGFAAQMKAEFTVECYLRHDDFPIVKDGASFRVEVRHDQLYILAQVGFEIPQPAYGFLMCNDASRQESAADYVIGVLMSVENIGNIQIAYLADLSAQIVGLFRKHRRVDDNRALLRNNTADVGSNIFGFDKYAVGNLYHYPSPVS